MKSSQRSLLVQMSATVAIFAAVLIASSFYSAHTRSQVQVGGPYYSQIIQTKESVAALQQLVGGAGAAPAAAGSRGQARRAQRPPARPGRRRTTGRARIKRS